MNPHLVELNKLLAEIREPVQLSGRRPTADDISSHYYGFEAAMGMVRKHLRDAGQSLASARSAGGSKSIEDKNAKLHKLHEALSKVIEQHG